MCIRDRQQELLGQLNGYIEEVYQGQELVSVFNYTDRAQEEFDRINGELQRTAQSAEIASGKVTPITDLVKNLGYAVSALLGCLSVLRGEMRSGDVQAMLQYTKQFSPVSYTHLFYRLPYMPSATALPRAF